SFYGQEDAADRWAGGAGGPDNAMTSHAPALCTTCGFFIPLAGRMGHHFGACANTYSPQDGQVVTRDHGCGGHSDTPEPKIQVDRSQPIWDTASDDTSLFD
ncbi:MAG: DUF3027 domain-containing protein, partial [Propionibacteriaceae bacterium]|nr:DUF3027 domain-containing protein [Propionibacteriaceae bacterium]